MTTQDAIAVSVHPISASSLVYGRIAFLAAMSGFLLFIALHVLKPDLDPAWRMVSEYALGRHGWVMTLCFFFLSLSCIASAAAIFPVVQTASGKVGLLLLVCACAGLALASIFPTDPVMVSPEDASRSAGLHALAVMIGVPTLTIAALLVSYSLVEHPIWEGVRAPLVAFAHLTWVSLALTVAVIAIWMPGNEGFGPSVQVGWPNRLMFLAYFGWLGSLTWPLTKQAWGRCFVMRNGRAADDHHNHCD